MVQLLLAGPRAVHDGTELPQELPTSSCSSCCTKTARMRLLSTLACALVLQSSLKYAHAAPHNPAAENAHHNWTLHQEASSDRLNESEFAWVVQTGRKSAEEAVAAVMVTFLQRASKHAGFVADVESIGKVKLADTSHIIERWSLARWEEHWPQQRLESDPDAETDMPRPRQQRPSFSHTAHKVLPGFNLMHLKWPAANWYIMIDDDTFVFRRALAKLLSGLDPQQKHYIGYPRQGASICKGPSASEDSEPSDRPFALAGCGMILSRGAMKSLAQVVVECTIASQDCFLDDVRLFLCLKDIGIHLDTTISYPAMNFAPTKNIDWGRLDTCLHPVVFHGVMPMEMHMLHAADLKHHGQANMADIFAEMATWGVHSDQTGVRYSTKHLLANISDVVDKRDCRLHCEGNYKCRAWSFANEGKFCELSDNLTITKESWRFNSGISQPAYRCQAA